MKFVLHMHRGDAAVEKRLQADSGLVVARVASDAEFQHEVMDARAAVISASYYTPSVAGMVSRASRLEWIQSAAAGYDPFIQNGMPQRIVITSAAGVWAPTVAEHALSLLLGLTRCLPRAERNRVARAYDREATANLVGSLEGGVLLIIGFGSIGREVAQRARVFGMKIIGANRSGRPAEGADEMISLDRLNDVLPRADAVVITIPLSEATSKLIGRDALSCMRESAILVNVSRGGVIDQPALVEVLRKGAIAGAGLDVFSSEPLPAGDPLWDLPNVILTPHVAGYAPASFERLADLVAENTRRLRAGEPLLNRIDPAEFGH